MKDSVTVRFLRTSYEIKPVRELIGVCSLTNTRIERRGQSPWRETDVAMTWCQ